MIILPAIIGATASYKAPITSSNVKLLLHFDGADNSTTIIDSSSYGNSLTISGSAVVSTALSKFGTASFLSNGSSYINAPANTDTSIANNAFTFEGWFYFGTLNSSGFMIWETNNLAFKINSSGFAVLSLIAGAQSGNTSFSSSTWHYFNISRASASANIILTINGTVDIAGSGNDNYGTISANTIGGSTSGFYNFSNCRLDEVRYTVGSTQSATVPTTAFT